MQMIVREFRGAAEASEALAAQIIPELQDGVARQGIASLLVPGGRTPQPLFHVLCMAAMDWSRIAVSLTDERWVDASHPGSNAALVRRELLQAHAAAARFIPLFNGGATASIAVRSVWASLASLPRPLDAVVLGMGDDGHFASLFPGNEGLGDALDIEAAPACVAMRAPVEPAERISLNLSALLQTRRLFLFVTGAEKRKLLEAATGDAGHAQLPVAALLRQNRCPVEIYWAP